ncbi:MAG: endonuclease protein [Hymenobacter sp.]|nr:endonuclease protein [Hymenobacter sp.]
MLALSGSWGGCGVQESLNGIQEPQPMTILNNLPHKKDERRTLRNNLTSAEAVLWNRLKSSQLNGRKFRRQHSIGEFILDFYCPQEKLAVELDGAGHFTASGNLHDAARTDYLNAAGIRVIRFENKLIWSSLESVLQTIESSFSTR